MKVDDVELVCPLRDLLDEQQMQRERIRALGQAQRPGHARHERGVGLRVAARKQRDVVTLTHELVGQRRDDALGSAVELRRHALRQRCDLRDAQALGASSKRTSPV